MKEVQAILDTKLRYSLKEEEAGGLAFSKNFVTIFVCLQYSHHFLMTSLSQDTLASVESIPNDGMEFESSTSTNPIKIVFQPHYDLPVNLQMIF